MKNKPNIKRLISIILVVATILTMQGLVVGAADIANGLRDESGNEDFVFEDNSSAYEYTNEQIIWSMGIIQLLQVLYLKKAHV